MNQNSTHRLAAAAAIAFSALFFHAACDAPTCPALEGQWSTREGQRIDFQKNGKAFWVTRFGSQMDTVFMEYRYDCSKRPVELDLFGFQSGPLTGKILFGALEWSSDTSFRFNAEPGTDAVARPQTFESDQTLKFFRKSGNRR